MEVQVMNRYASACLRVILGSMVTMEAWADLSQMESSLTGGRLSLSWTAPSGRDYGIEISGALASGWQEQAQVSGTDGPVQWSDPAVVGPGTQRFYRVRENGGSVLPATEDLIFALDGVGLDDVVPVMRDSAANVLETIVAATQLEQSQVPILTGTVTIAGQTQESVTYSAEPTDRLRLVPLEGPALEWVVHQFNGDNPPFEWTQVYPYGETRYRVTEGDQFTETRMTGDFASPLLPGVPLTLDVLVETRTWRLSDQFGSEQEDEERVSGTISGPGMVLTVGARHHFEQILVYELSRENSTNNNWLSHRLELGADVYVWTQVRKLREFQDGFENNPDTYWDASGTITRNGEGYAYYRKVLTPVGDSVLDLRFQLVLPSGVRDIEQWTIQVPEVFR